MKDFDKNDQNQTKDKTITPETISQGKFGTRYEDTPYWATRGSETLPSTSPVNWTLTSICPRQGCLVISLG